MVIDQLVRGEWYGSCLEACGGLRGGHAGIVDVDDAPAGRKFAVDLRFAAMSGDGFAVFSERGVEVPVKLSPGCVSINVDGDVARSELALGECFSHQARVDVRFNLFEAMFVAKRVDEGNFR